MLYGSSFLLPPHLTGDFHIGGGFMAFIETPIWALIAATDGIQSSHWQLCVLALAMVVGWCANFTIYFRLPFPWALLAIVSPWILYLGMTFLGSTVGLSTMAIEFVPFYPWACGIALMQTARLWEPKPIAEARTIWNGF